MKKDLLHPKYNHGELLRPKIPCYWYTTVSYNFTLSTITFFVNFLSCKNKVKCILQYHHGTNAICLFYSKRVESQLLRYMIVGYLSNPYKARSKMGYVFIYGNTTISWRLVKHTMVTASLNHWEILAIYKASHECIWLRSLRQHI